MKRRAVLARAYQVRRYRDLEKITEVFKVAYSGEPADKQGFGVWDADADPIDAVYGCYVVKEFHGTRWTNLRVLSPNEFLAEYQVEYVDTDGGVVADRIPAAEQVQEPSEAESDAVPEDAEDDAEPVPGPDGSRRPDPGKATQVLLIDTLQHFGTVVKFWEQGITDVEKGASPVSADATYFLGDHLADQRRQFLRKVLPEVEVVVSVLIRYCLADLLGSERSKVDGFGESSDLGVGAGFQRDSDFCGAS
ncbi:hypothetical protein [Auritidibacter ignavus]|uniref:hypothetical protein n=1 Tax=Auritidibacter ignavus TaxID=678932 RepID=UPI002FE61164